MTVDYDYDYDDDEEELVTIRMKWCADGARTMDEIVEKLQEQIQYIRHLKAQGYELVDVMNDDYGHAAKLTDENQPIEPVEVLDVDETVAADAS